MKNQTFTVNQGLFDDDKYTFDDKKLYCPKNKPKNLIRRTIKATGAH